MFNLRLKDGGRSETNLSHRQKGSHTMQENVPLALLKPRWNQTARWLVLVGGVINPIAFVLAYTVAGILRPGYSPIHQAISDLGVGPNGPLMDTIAVVHALLLIAFAVGIALLMRRVLTAGWWWVGVALLVVRGLAQVTTAIFTGAGGRAAGTGALCGDAFLVCRLRVAAVCPGRLAPEGTGASNTGEDDGAQKVVREQRI
jgi:hypothetical protein